MTTIHVFKMIVTLLHVYNWVELFVLVYNDTIYKYNYFIIKLQERGGKFILN